MPVDILRVDPAQLSRLEEIDANLADRLQEAKEQGWLGEVAAIETTMAAAARNWQLDPDLDQQLEPADDRILILHSVRLSPPWRGFGLGALLAGTAIRKLSSGARAAICYPAPLGDTDDPGHDDQPDDHGEWQHAVASLQRVWGRLGFTDFGDGIYVLDLSLVTLDEKLGQLRRHAERYSTSRT